RLSCWWVAARKRFGRGAAEGPPAHTPNERRASMLRLAVPLAAAALLVSAAAAAPPAITPSSIDGVKIGMSKAQVKALLGPSTVRHGTYDNPGQPDGWTALVFAKRMVAVYFDGTV